MQTNDNQTPQPPRMSLTPGKPCATGVRPEILTDAEIYAAAPFLRKHPRLMKIFKNWIILDKCNRVHGTYCYTSGVPFSNLLIDEAYRINKVTHNEEVLDRFPTGAFLTVSNHPLGALDGIMLIDIVGRHRPDFKVMVNMILYNIQAMRPTFIPVDPSGSNDPEKKRTTMHGIREAMMHVKRGHPLGFFPAGAVSKVKRNLRISDRPWQESVIRLAKQLRVPIIPVYFHDHNSAFFNFLGMIDWRIRTLRLPRELFNKTGKTMHVSFGEPVMPEEQDRYDDLKEFGDMLRRRTYDLKTQYPVK